MIELYVDNLNLTTFIQQKTDVVENMRKIYGNNGGMSTSGEEFVDLIVVQIDPSFRLKPLPRDIYAQIMTLMQKPTVAIRYTSVMSDSLRSITAAPTELVAHYATDARGSRIYDGETISFRQVSV